MCTWMIEKQTSCELYQTSFRMPLAMRVIFLYEVGILLRGLGILLDGVGIVFEEPW